MAETVITMVSNPFCGPCAVAHQRLETWLSQREDLQLKVVFTTADHDDDLRTKVARHVIALSMLDNKDLTKRALDEWYAQPSKKYESWAAKFPVVLNGEMDRVTKKQKEWCEMAEISLTPTILVNGYKLVEPYTLEDIKYLLE
jgi:3'-phosphoadenosine 5'-phosphosulfate (PAPS) 3'-phosphatase